MTGLRAMCRSLTRTLRGFRHDTGGSVAVEFGIFTAMLMPIFVMAVDLGFVLRERIVMDHTVRAGIFAAVRPDATRTSVEQSMRTAFEGQDRDRVSLASLSVAESCFCPDAPEREVSCTTSCGPGATFGAYTISLSAAYDAVLLPASVQSGLGMLDARVRVEFLALAP